MTDVIKTAIEIEDDTGDRMLLPAYRFENDAKTAQKRLININSVKSVRVHSVPVEEQNELR